MLFVGSLFALYFSPVFGYLMDSHWGHAAMQLHFIAVGTLFFYVLVGVDPSPRSLQPLRPPPPATVGRRWSSPPRKLATTAR